MKPISFLCVLLGLSILVEAQDITAGKGIPEAYDRSSVTVFYLDLSSGRHHNRLKQKLGNIVLSDKFDSNQYTELFLKSPVSSRGTANNFSNQILKQLERERAGHEIIAKWYSRQPDGTMSLDLVHQRGRFSVTVSDFLKAQTTKRGNADLEDYGNRLVNLSHILVVDVASLQTAAEAKRDQFRGWVGSVTGYLYRIDFSDDVRYTFYDTWIYDDDSEEEVERKRKAFDELVIPINFVTSVSINVSATQPTSDTGIGLLFTPKSEDELLQEFAQKTYDEVLYRIEMEVEEFQVLTPIYEVRPIRAQIGLKEGLKTDFRFFAYEYVWDPVTETSVPRRRGVVRATSDIVDNRVEATKVIYASRFYQTSGRKLEPGFTLQQQNDFGLEITVGAEIGGEAGLGGFCGRIDYRLGRVIGIPAFFIYADFGIDVRSYNINGSSSNDLSPAFLRYGAGVAKGLQLMRNIELRPYFGLGLDNASHSNITDVSAVYIKPGINLSINITHSFQLVGGIGSYLFITQATDENGVFYGNWDEYFPGRSGPSPFLGVKIQL